MKKILHLLLYFLAVLLLILGLAVTVGLSEGQTLFILIAAVLLRIIPVFFRILLKNRRILFRILLLLTAAAGIFVLCSRFYHERSYIPENLLELAQKYPETAEFVADYPKEKYKRHKIDLSDEVQAGSIPLFIQWDKRWGYEDYGSSCIAVSGCGPTALSMVVCGLTGTTEWNPYEMAKFSQEQGYYVPGQGTSWDLMTAGAAYFGLSAASGEISADYIRENLSQNRPIICSMYPGDFTYTGHFIVLTGIDSNGKIIVNDSNSRNNSEKHWDMETLLPQIRNLWTYQI